MEFVSTTHTNSKATPINDNDYSCHNYNSCRTYLTNNMGSISCHITPLVINSLGSGHTQAHIQTSAQDQFQETRRLPGLKNHELLRAVRSIGASLGGACHIKSTVKLSFCLLACLIVACLLAYIIAYHLASLLDH